MDKLNSLKNMLISPEAVLRIKNGKDRRLAYESLILQNKMPEGEVFKLNPNDPLSINLSKLLGQNFDYAPFFIKKSKDSLILSSPLDIPYKKLERWNFRVNDTAYRLIKHQESKIYKNQVNKIKKLVRIPFIDTVVELNSEIRMNYQFSAEFIYEEIPLENASESFNELLKRLGLLIGSSYSMSNIPKNEDTLLKYTNLKEYTEACEDNLAGEKDSIRLEINESNQRAKLEILEMVEATTPKNPMFETMDEFIEFYLNKERPQENEISEEDVSKIF